jgi:methyl-accepting chemotaxis protein
MHAPTLELREEGRRHADVGRGAAVLTSGVAALALRAVVERMETVILVHGQNVLIAQTMATRLEGRASAIRGYLLTGDESFLTRLASARDDFARGLAQLRIQTARSEDQVLLDEIQRKNLVHHDVVDRVLPMRRAGAATKTVVDFFEQEIRPKFESLRQAIFDYADRQANLLETQRREAARAAGVARTAMLTMALGAVLMAGGLGFVLTRSLKRQIGSAVQHIQGSSTQLQSAATQQASGAKEQATAMNEITITVQQLLATARQIAESAQRVARIADETATSANDGGETMLRAQEAVASIRRQVDIIVNHMMDLGKRSQHIGGVLEIINELAEQTNILAINATIEAAGAGELGRRFAAVADEIRKLADRVSTSTKEIRSHIDEVRSAVHTTVLATESGSKAVEAGAGQFGEVALAFKQIASLVGATTEAAKEIGLSTKQQSTAVEQVNVATANVAQAAKEAEASSLQTVQTVGDLARLSSELLLIVNPPATA